MCCSCRSSDSRSAPNRGRHTFDPTRERRLIGTCVEDPDAFSRTFALGVRPLFFAAPQKQDLWRLLIRLNHESKLCETNVLSTIARCPDPLKYPSVMEVADWMNDRELRVEASARALIDDWHLRESLSEGERWMSELGQGYRHWKAVNKEHKARLDAMEEPEKGKA